MVAADGSGNVRTVAEAINRAPEGSVRRYVIRVKAGVYRENVVVPPRKTNIMLVGDGRGATVVTGSRSVSDGSTTFSSATFGKHTLLISYFPFPSYDHPVFHN